MQFFDRIVTFMKRKKNTTTTNFWIRVLSKLCLRRAKKQFPFPLDRPDNLNLRLGSNSTTTPAKFQCCVRQYKQDTRAGNRNMTRHQSQHILTPCLTNETGSSKVLYCTQDYQEQHLSVLCDVDEVEA